MHYRIQLIQKSLTSRDEEEMTHIVKDLFITKSHGRNRNQATEDKILFFYVYTRKIIHETQTFYQVKRSG